MWISQHLELEPIKEGQSRKNIEFKYEGDINITSIVPACSCTTPEFNKETGILSVNYKGETIPHHLRYKNSFTTKKVMKVVSDKGEFELSFRITVLRKK